jgi:DNA modification methylase
MTPHYTDPWLTVYLGDCREVMAEMEPESVHCVVTSPPYWGLRDYGQPGQLGLEPTPEEYVADMVAVFREVRRVLRSDGTVWLNLGDSYASHDPGGYRPGEHLNPGGRPAAKGSGRNRAGIYGRNIGLKPKDLVGIPWGVAFALQADGWYLRSDIIWSKPNPMPESVTDRPTKSHEYLFLLSKSARYYYDADAVRETPKWQDADELEVNAQARQKARLIRDGKIADQQSVGGYHFAGDRDGYGRGSLGLGEQTLSMNPAGRNLRSVWQIATAPYPGAHFATFPPKLVEPCIRAGTSERGVCPECGAPWVREVERTPMVMPDGSCGCGVTHGTNKSDQGGYANKDWIPQGMARAGRSYCPNVETTGWRSSCRCIGRWERDSEIEAQGGPRVSWPRPSSPIPATVLDPFAGSGTTGLVAQRLSRRAVLIDLSMDYLGQLMERNRDIPLGLEAV